MSQITRCPHCQTAFKVVADQLRISDGWVRCGQCHEVFEARQHLWQAPQVPPQPVADASAPQVWRSARENGAPPDSTEIDAEAEPKPDSEHVAGPQWEAALLPEGSDEQPMSAHDPSPVDDGVNGAADDEGELDLLSGFSPDEDEGEDVFAPLSDAQMEHAAGAEPSWIPAEAPDGATLEAVGEQADVGTADAERGEMAEQNPQESEVAAPAEPDTAEPEAAEPGEAEQDFPEHGATALDDAADEAADMPAADASALDAAAHDDAGVAEPQFVRAARRQAFWRRPLVRLALVVLALVLLAALALQVLVHERDMLAARYPVLRPLLAALCEPLQCTVQAPRRIDAVVIDGSSFLQVDGAAATYELRLDLRNQADMAVATPALELTLTDEQGRPLLRRVVQAQQMAAPAQMQARASWSGTLRLRVQAGVAPVAGYRLLVFYP